MTTSASSGAAGGRRKRFVPSRDRVGITILVIGLAVLVLLPLVRLQQRAFGDGAAGYRTAYGDAEFWTVLGTTLQLAIATTAVSLVLGTVLAFVAERLPRRWTFLQLLPLLPIVLPAIAMIIGWTFLLNLRTGYINVLLRRLPWWADLDAGPIDVYSKFGIVVVTAASFSSFVYAFVSAGLRGIPSHLFEAARSAGSSEIRATMNVSLPLLRPVFAYATGVVLMLALGQLTAPLLLGRQRGINVLATEMLEYTRQSPSDYAAAAAIGSPLLIFGIAMVIFQRVIVGDTARFVTHGGKGFTHRSRQSWWAVPAILAYGLVVLVLPILALIDRAMSPFSSGDIRFDRYSLDNIRTTLNDDRLRDAVFTSVSVSLGAVTIALVIGFLVSTVLVRRTRYPILQRVADLVVNIPLMIPATVFGVGFLMTYAGDPFNLYGSKIVMILVYVTLMVPFSTRMQLTALISIGNHYSEASRVSGAGSFRTNLRIVFPLARPAVGGAAALMFVLLSHEFSASLLVRSSKTQVMGTILFDFYENGTFGWVATMALVMALITSIGLAAAFLIGGRRILDSV